MGGVIVLSVPFARPILKRYKTALIMKVSEPIFILSTKSESACLNYLPKMLKIWSWQLWFNTDIIPSNGSQSLLIT